MKVGIIGDSHDHLPRINRAIELFRQRGVALVLHTGDYIAPFSLAPLLDREFEFVGVLGNNDGEVAGLLNLSRGRIHKPPYSFKWKEKKLLLLHEELLLPSLLKSQEFDLIAYGHTHELDIRREGRTLLINPGEAGGWLHGRCTAAIVDLEEVKGEAIPL